MLQVPKREGGMSAKDMVEALRKKVLAFEAEIASSMSVLSLMESELNDVCTMRKSWITEVSGIDEIEAQTFRAQAEALRKRASIINVEMHMDAIRLNGFYEAQQLQQLVVATRPREEGESDQDREKEINAMIKEGMVKIGRAVNESLQIRLKFKEEVDNMSRQLISLKSEYKEKKRIRIESILGSIKEYDEHLSEIRRNSEDTYKKVTNDYLILRHNARVAKEILVRSQNEAKKVRNMLESNINKLMKESVAHRDRLEKNSSDELQVLTEDLRKIVINKEREYENILVRVEGKKRHTKKILKSHKQMIRDYDAKYNALQQKRRGEILVIEKELQKLRDMISEVECQLHDKENNSGMQMQQIASILASLQVELRESLDKNADLIF